MSNPSQEPTHPSPEQLREWAAALKHDLGKYVAWRSANLPDAAWTGALDELTAQSIRADILATREGADGVEPAWSLFDRLTTRWPHPWPAELQAVAAAVAVLRDLSAVLGDNDRAALASARSSIHAAQSTIRAELAALHRRLGREA